MLCINKHLNQVIILGGHIQALGLARQAYDMGLKVLLFIPERLSVARFSRKVHKVRKFDRVNQISDLLEEYANNDTLVIPTSDEYIEYLHANYEQIKNRCIVGIPSTECVNIFSNKRKTYQFAERNEIAHPKSWYPDTLDDIPLIAENVKYPIVIKPAIMYEFYKHFGKKAFLCKSKSELYNKCKIIAKSYPIDGLLIQEFLSGGAKCLYSYGVFAVNGNPKAWLTANRIRQNPMDFGNSTTFAITCDIPEIELCAKKILNSLNYTGLAELEFMYDYASGKYKFLEINLRAWKWHLISKGLGFGFFTEYIKAIKGENSDFVQSNNQVAWVERLTDFAVVFKEIICGKMNLSDVITTYKNDKIYAVWDREDIAPFFTYFFLAPVLFFTR